MWMEDDTPILLSVFDDIEPNAMDIGDIFTTDPSIPWYLMGTGPMPFYSYRELVECVSDGLAF